MPTKKMNYKIDNLYATNRNKLNNFNCNEKNKTIQYEL